MADSNQNIVTFRLTGTLSTSGSTVNVSNDILRGTAIDVENASITLQNEGETVFELIKATITGGVLTTSKRGITEDKTLTEDSALKREWRPGTVGFVTLFASDTLDREGDTITGNINFSGTDIYGIRVNNLTTAQRVALTPANGVIVYDTDLGENYQYIANAWSAVSAGSTQPNASATVAGKVEIATSAQSVAGTDTGETGALLGVLPSDIAKNAQSDTFKYGADAGGDDTYVIALVPVLTAYTTGQKLRFKATTANTGACSIDFGPGVKSIKDRAGNDPVNGMIATNDFTDVYYDGTNFVIDSSPKLATNAEATTGTDITKYITAKQAKDNYGLIDSISLTRDVAAASGTVTYNHSLGKVPTFITINAKTSNNGSTLETTSFGTWKTPSTNICAYGAGGSITATTSSAFSVIGYASATLATSGVIQNVTSTQFDIVWTKSGSPGAGQILSANVILI